MPFRAVYLINLVPERYIGFEIRDVQRRSYPADYRDLSPALIGWVGFPTDRVLEEGEEDLLLFQELRSREPEEIDLGTAEHIDWLKRQLRHRNYMPDEEQGRAGLEALLEPVLRGRRGWQIVEHDSAKRDTRLLEMTPPVHGRDVRLSLDVDLQLACERVLESVGQTGAVAMVDPRDGAIRVLATWPSATRDEIRKNYGDLIQDPLQPLAHRAYRPPGNPPPPGSVFKVVTTAAALESGQANTNTVFECSRYLNVGRTRLKCLASHGRINVITALEKSCNIYFYQLSRTVGLRPMLDMAARLGIGEATGFGDPRRLGLEGNTISLGEMPCPFQDGGGVTFTMRTAIGHAAVDDVTPLQIAGLMAGIASGGCRIRPWLVDMIGSEPAPRDLPSAPVMSQRSVAAIHEGMIAGARTGSARPRDGYDLQPFRVAAKTGTPEAAGAEDHSWIAGFFPHDDPQIAFAVFLENVGEAGPAVRLRILCEILRQPEFEDLLRGGIR